MRCYSPLPPPQQPAPVTPPQLHPPLFARPSPPPLLLHRCITILSLRSSRPPAHSKRLPAPRGAPMPSWASPALVRRWCACSEQRCCFSWSSHRLHLRWSWGSVLRTGWTQMLPGVAGAGYRPCSPTSCSTSRRPPPHACAALPTACCCGTCINCTGGPAGRAHASCL